MASVCTNGIMPTTVCMPVDSNGQTEESDPTKSSHKKRSHDLFDNDMHDIAPKVAKHEEKSPEKLQNGKIRTLTDLDGVLANGNDHITSMQSEVKARQKSNPLSIDVDIQSAKFKNIIQAALSKVTDLSNPLQSQISPVPQMLLPQDATDSSQMCAVESTDAIQQCENELLNEGVDCEFSDIEDDALLDDAGEKSHNVNNSISAIIESRVLEDSQSSCLTESSVNTDNQQTESGVDTDNRPTESSVNIDNRPTESGVNTDHRPTESSVNTDNQQTESSVNTDNQQTESSVNTDNQQTESSVNIDNRPTESPMIDNQSVESSIVCKDTNISTESSVNSILEQNGIINDQTVSSLDKFCDQLETASSVSLDCNTTNEIERSDSTFKDALNSCEQSTCSKQDSTENTLSVVDLDTSNENIKKSNENRDTSSENRDSSNENRETSKENRDHSKQDSTENTVSVVDLDISNENSDNSTSNSKVEYNKDIITNDWNNKNAKCDVVEKDTENGEVETISSDDLELPVVKVGNEFSSNRTVEFILDEVITKVVESKELNESNECMIIEDTEPSDLENESKNSRTTVPENLANEIEKSSDCETGTVAEKLTDVCKLSIDCDVTNEVTQDLTDATTIIEKSPENSVQSENSSDKNCEHPQLEEKALQEPSDNKCDDVEFSTAVGPTEEEHSRDSLSQKRCAESPLENCPGKKTRLASVVGGLMSRLGKQSIDEVPTDISIEESDEETESPIVSFNEKRIKVMLKTTVDDYIKEAKKQLTAKVGDLEARLNSMRIENSQFSKSLKKLHQKPKLQVAHIGTQIDTTEIPRPKPRGSPRGSNDSPASRSNSSTALRANTNTTSKGNGNPTSIGNSLPPQSPNPRGNLKPLLPKSNTNTVREMLQEKRKSPAAATPIPVVDLTEDDDKPTTPVKNTAKSLQAASNTPSSVTNQCVQGAVRPGTYIMHTGPAGNAVLVPTSVTTSSAPILLNNTKATNAVVQRSQGPSSSTAQPKQAATARKRTGCSRNPEPPAQQPTKTTARKRSTPRIPESKKPRERSTSPDVVITTVHSPAPAKQHPAPLPPTPTSQASAAHMRQLPPRPRLQISRVNQGIVLSWTMDVTPESEDIATYQLFAYQESSAAPASTLWKKVGDVKALALPMACTLTQFQEGNKYHFAVRAMDKHKRVGSFSEPCTIHLTR